MIFYLFQAIIKFGESRQNDDDHYRDDDGDSLCLTMMR